MRELFRDFRYGARSFLRSPGFALAGILALALGIGANTAIFSIIDGIVLRSLPYPEPDRIVIVYERTPGGGTNAVAAATFLDWSKQSSGFSAIAAFTGGTLTLTGSGEPEHIATARVSAGLFDVLGVKPVLGRGFLPEEDAPGGAAVLVLSHGMWERRFGRDPGIVGRDIAFDGRKFTVVGVLPASFRFVRPFEALTPLALDPATAARDFHYLTVLGRLKPGVSVEQARAEMGTIGGNLARQYPEVKKGWSAGVDSLHERTSRGPRNDFPLLAGASLFVLLIACANVANLLLGKAAARRREIAIRAAMGAGRMRLIRQMLAESILLAMPGGALGVLLAYWTVRALHAAVPPWALPPGTTFEIDARVLAFTLGLSVLTGVIFGLVPALRASRVTLHDELKQSSRSSGGHGSARLRSMLVVGELSLSMVLLAGAGLQVRSLMIVHLTRAGFDAGDVLTIRVPLPAERYATADQLRLFSRDALERLRAVPGVQSAALSSSVPLTGYAWNMPFAIAEQPSTDAPRRPSAPVVIASPEYFRTMGVSVRLGRPFSEADNAASPRVTVVNETFARRFLRNENPLGKHVRMQELVPNSQQLAPWVNWEIVGVVESMGFGELERLPPEIYLPFAQSPQAGGVFSMRTSLPPLQAANPAKAAIHAIDRNLPVTEIRTMEQVRYSSFAIPRVLTALIGGFGFLALLLAVMGTYGLMSWSVAQRTHEMGIRTALGASRGDLLRLVMRQAFVLAGVGFLIGMGGALAVSRLLRRFLFGVTPHDPATFAAASALLLGVALAAAYFPARRAARIDPMTALREE